MFIVARVLRAGNLWPIEVKVGCRSCSPMPKINLPQYSREALSLLCSFQGSPASYTMGSEVLLNIRIYLFQFIHRTFNPDHVLRLPENLKLAVLGATTALWYSGSMAAASCWAPPYLSSSLSEALCWRNFIGLSPFSPISLPVSFPYIHTYLSIRCICVFVRTSEKGSF